MMNVERLTTKEPNGYTANCDNCPNRLVHCYDSSDCAGALTERLAAYEDTNLTPSDIVDLRNELCLKCGRYHEAHNGACEGCRWKV